VKSAILRPSACPEVETRVSQFLIPPSLNTSNGIPLSSYCSSPHSVIPRERSESRDLLLRFTRRLSDPCERIAPGGWVGFFPLPLSGVKIAGLGRRRNHDPLRAKVPPPLIGACRAGRFPGGRSMSWRRFAPTRLKIGFRVLKNLQISGICPHQQCETDHFRVHSGHDDATCLKIGSIPFFQKNFLPVQPCLFGRNNQTDRNGPVWISHVYICAGG